MSKIVQNIQNYILRHGLLKEGQRVLVALSGGADSVCLLVVLRKLGYECFAAHCNFHLRGDESNRDERFVTELCSRLSVPLYITHFDTMLYAEEHGVSIEMAARDLRYDFFKDILNQYDIPTLAVGHHLGDNVETVLLNMVRGTGIRGAAGIMPRRQMEGYDIVRPLLSVTHDDIKEYLSGLEQSWVEDSTNQHDDVGRNIIRLNVIPQFLRVNPAALQNVNSTIENLREVERVFCHAIAHDLDECLVADGALSMERLFATVSPQSVLHEWLRGRGFRRSQEMAILAAAQKRQSGKLFVGEGMDEERLLIDRECIILESAQRFLTAADVTMQTKARDEVTITADPTMAFLDADKVKGKLYIRTPREQDSFQPFGMKGRKLLSDFLTDKKLNLFQKQHQLLLCDDEDIVWVVGLRSSEKFKIEDNTKRVIVVSLLPSHGGR